ncbi:hypothetical protein B0W47_03785 [Komagataeibacter nataicola]|uniref:Uncharacterized protein n=2 Tax=Komagataeibacter nataicola TaxID=265960 RepID=A0A9N7C593_9PROT|nr:hypothetical protein [Komagataeibacter nataicola]AQU86726.1 hypothetical protein B0W47_03785 [Komagataeibacter nataicola]PYD65782.1 hypothetical protein CDI09_11955 [Komagataeibacter nataicola]GBR14227.1 hypothetical protein AA0616_0261 [Komagataeibacter nataicola NRIC 0616]
MSWSTKEGTATITGSASKRVFDHQSVPNLHGGLIQYAVGKGHELTCAGYDVQLLPQSPASDPVVDNMFRYNTMTGPKVDSAALAPFVRHATCGADGEFAFSRLPAGVWYAVTEIGAMNIAVKEIRTQPDQTTSVILQHRWNYPPSWRHGPSLW